jgi:sulfhydrogenase subunit alpha
MSSKRVSIDAITKIEGGAGLEVVIEDDAVKDLRFMIADYRRFFTTAVRGKRMVAVPSFLSRICGTCSVAHLFASLMAIEDSQGIEVSEQTKALRRLAYDGLMIRDHALHLYFFVLPDLLGVDSIFDISDDPDDPGHTLLRDSFDVKRLGTDITNVVIGAAIHAPLPTIGGMLRNPDPSKFPDLISRLAAVRPQVLRAIGTFSEWDASLVRNVDYLCLRNDARFDFLEGDIVNSNGRRVPAAEFEKYLEYVQIPYSHAEGYRFSDTGEDYLVGALARLNLNPDLLHPRTRADAAPYLSAIPSNNVYHNNLAQAIEVLQCVDEAIDILRNIRIADEEPVRRPPRAGVGMGVIEAPRGLLYHKAQVNEGGVVEDYDVIVPTAQNQINIENDLKDYFNENLDSDEDK